MMTHSYRRRLFFLWLAVLLQTATVILQAWRIHSLEQHLLKFEQITNRAFQNQTQLNEQSKTLFCGQAKINRALNRQSMFAFDKAFGINRYRVDFPVPAECESPEGVK